MHPEYTDPFNLARFLEAQDVQYAEAVGELSFGRKRSHWMWFIFPQWTGLGSSPPSQRFAIRSLDEARAYLNHPVLGPRLIECTRLVNMQRRIPVRAIFGSTDEQKFRSCMTLFDLVADPGSIFSVALDQHFAGERDDMTLQLVAEARAASHTSPPAQE